MKLCSPFDAGIFYMVLEGKRHDASMLAESGFLADLERFAFSEEGQPMCIYGDPAYPLRVHLQAPFRGAVLTADMQDFNKSMSSIRVSVEWLFGYIVNRFKFMDFKKNLKWPSVLLEKCTLQVQSLVMH